MGIKLDSTPFTGIDKDKMCSVLETCGFERYGNEVLYSGINGEQLESSYIYWANILFKINTSSYKKMFARATDPMTALTHQPVGGRAAGGGLRIGEMERDGLIAPGASMFLKESMIERADKYHAWIK